MPDSQLRYYQLLASSSKSANGAGLFAPNGAYLNLSVFFTMYLSTRFFLRAAGR
jgi:hypothetical protein